MTDQSRQPKGIPVGGQFAASAREEADTVSLEGDLPALTGEQRQRLSEHVLASAGQALRAEIRDTLTPGYHHGIGQVETEAFWLLQREDVPPPHEVAWHADQFAAEVLHPDTGSRGTHAAQRDFAENLGPYAPMSAEQAAQVSDHFMARAIDLADQIRAAGPWANDRRGFDQGQFYAACTNAIRFRAGAVEPDSRDVEALTHYLRNQAWQRAETPRHTRSPATPAEGRAAFEDCFEHYQFD